MTILLAIIFILIGYGMYVFILELAKSMCDDDSSCQWNYFHEENHIL